MNISSDYLRTKMDFSKYILSLMDEYSRHADVLRRHDYEVTKIITDIDYLNGAVREIIANTNLDTKYFYTVIDRLKKENKELKERLDELERKI